MNKSEIKTALIAVLIVVAIKKFWPTNPLGL